MREERRRKEAQAIVNAELSEPDSKIRRKIDYCLTRADKLYKEGRLKESRQMYAQVINMGKFLETQAQEYMRGCSEHYDELSKKSEEALALYRSGRVEEAKKMWEDVKAQARPRPLEFTF
jgi:soluble cytochrome b562